MGKMAQFHGPGPAHLSLQARRCCATPRLRFCSTQQVTFASKVKGSGNSVYVLTTQYLPRVGLAGRAVGVSLTILVSEKKQSLGSNSHEPGVRLFALDSSTASHTEPDNNAENMMLSLHVTDRSTRLTHHRQRQTTCETSLKMSSSLTSVHYTNSTTSTHTEGAGLTER